jgi:LEA14-like dessication related protein
MVGDRMIHRSKRNGWWALPVAMLVTACSTMPTDFEAPRVHISDMTAKDLAIFEQRFDVKIRIQNPNNTDLSINGLKFDIDLNEREFANGMSGQRLVVPRFGSEVVNVEVFSTLGSFLRQVQSFNSGMPQKVRYRLKGTAFVDSPGTFKAPFDESGEIDLNLGGDVGGDIEKAMPDVEKAP